MLTSAKPCCTLPLMFKNAIAHAIVAAVLSAALHHHEAPHTHEEDLHPRLRREVASASR